MKRLKQAKQKNDGMTPLCLSSGYFSRRPVLVSLHPSSHVHFFEASLGVLPLLYIFYAFVVLMKVFAKYLGTLLPGMEMFQLLSLISTTICVRLSPPSSPVSHGEVAGTEACGFQALYLTSVPLDVVPRLTLPLRPWPRLPMRGCFAG